jgi:Uma2 family endonuclease
MRKFGGSADALEASPDQRVVLHDVSWPQYESILEVRGERSGTRIAYLDGELELMTPSFDHEAISRMIGRLLEAWAEESEVELIAAGSWTLKVRDQKGAIEPDSCYLIGGRKDVPDLAIEVVWTSGGVDKLEVYRRLGVNEVWFWEDAQLSVHVLGADGYEQRGRSQLFPDLDIGLLARFITAPNQTTAVRTYRSALRGTKG